MKIGIIISSNDAETCGNAFGFANLLSRFSKRSLLFWQSDGFCVY